jgi:HK97 gp10 family phage protein
MGMLDLSVLGNKAILDNLDKLQVMVREGVQKKLEEAGEVALEVANELVPVDTGYLKSTLYMETQPGEVKVGADASYAIFLEIGTVHQRAQPYLVPAMLAGAEHLKSSLPGLI